jgi:nucleotide-binding universal stress UspA family protein
MLAFDGSEASTKASDYAIYLSKLENATLTFVHVLDNIKQGGVIGLRARYGDVKIVEAYKNSRKKAIEKRILPLQKKASDQGIKTNISIIEDEHNSKIETIVKFIEINNIDLVVTGSRGLSQFKQMLLGSVAYGVTSHSTCPVLIIR